MRGSLDVAGSVMLAAVVGLIGFVVASCDSPTGNVVAYDSDVDVQYLALQDAPPEPQTHFVNITGFRFEPQRIVVQQGDRVLFVNSDDRRQKVVEKQIRMFESPWLERDESFVHTFSAPGTTRVELLNWYKEHDTRRREYQPSENREMVVMVQ